MSAHAWPGQDYDDWRDTCDTLHAHTQVLGKLVVELAPRERQLQHAALRLTTRGWETHLLPAPDGPGALVALLDLRTHEAVVEHSDGRTARVPLTPNRSVGAVARDVLEAVRRLVGPVQINPRPQEVPWTVALDEDEEHHTYDVAQVRTYHSMATQAELVLAAVRAPYSGRATNVNAWWGTFDLALSLFSGRTVDPASDEFIMRNSTNAEQIEVGWWPGDQRYPRAAFFAFAYPAPEGFAGGTVSPPAARWDTAMGEYLLDWDDVVASSDPFSTATQFARSVILHGCTVCSWDPALRDSVEGTPPPVT